MSRLSLVLSLVAAVTLLGCIDADGPDEAEATVTAAVESGAPRGAFITDVTREHVTGDIWHHSLTLVLGDTPNARIRIHRIVRERAPWLPRHTAAGVMLLHGDFSSFGSNFAPSTLDPTAQTGMAVALAGRDIDVWGFDRRWATAPADGDVSDLGEMGLAQELDDTSRAFTVARAVRLATGSGGDRLHLIGFSRGGLIGYAFAAADAARPAASRQVKGLVPLDIWAVPPPEDVDAIGFLCEGAPFEYDLVAQGVIDSDNFFQITAGELALSDPDGISPFDPDQTNRGLVLGVAGKTYNFFAPTALFHHAAPILDGTQVIGLSESPEAAIDGWYAHASPHQSMLEAADTDAAQCNDGSGPTIDLSRIHVPLLYIGAAGGYGAHGLYSTTLVGSTDVTTRMIQRFDSSQVAIDTGHADLLFATDADAVVWQPLAQWLVTH